MSKTFKIGAAAGTMVAALTLMNGAAAAQVVGGSSMRLGEQVHAPVGFLDLCRRTPTQCLQPGTPVEQAADLSKDFGRMYWRAVFGRPIEAPAAAPPNAPVRLSPPAYPSTNAPSLNPHAVWQRRPAVFTEAANQNLRLEASLDDLSPESATKADQNEDGGEIIAPIVKVSVQETSVLRGAVLTWKPEPRSPERLVPPAAPQKRQQETLVVDKALWAQLNAVNRNTNRAIRHTPDAKQYGREDYWAIPTGRGARGDCEDYVLAKRSALIEAGVSPDALSIAIVRTQWGELHAVLLVATDRGELVLDNLSQWIRRWDTVGYDWLERQVGADLLTWRAVADAGRAEAA